MIAGVMLGAVATGWSLGLEIPGLDRAMSALHGLFGVPSQRVVSGIVLPHHNIVLAQRTAMWEALVPTLRQPRTVILVSPNHYASGKGSIQTTKQDWKTVAGILSPNAAVIDAITQKAGVSVEPVSFVNEHGIKLIVGEVKHYFTGATVVPIILKRNIPRADVEKLAVVLHDSCADCLLVASVDFSHYQPAILADLHDKTSIRALEQQDEAALLKKSEVDSPEALMLLARWAQLHGTNHFTLFNHTNSGVITGQADSNTTSHVFGWYERGEVVKPVPAVSFAIGGDAMLGRDVSRQYFKQGSITSVAAHLGERAFWGVDAALVNLEGAIVDNWSQAKVLPGTMTFHFSPQVVGLLTFLHLDAVSLANNHSNNGGAAGLAFTRTILQKARIIPIGGPAGGDVMNVGEFQGNGLKLVVIGVHALVEVPDIKKLIQDQKKDPHTRVVVMPHWGSEYKEKHNPQQARLAHQWIDAGADAVVGSHPHVIQDVEVYQGRPIVYSLGNLIFDQYFSRAVQEGLVVTG